MSMKSRNFSLDFSSPYLLYDYVEDKKETIHIDIFDRSLASLMYYSKKAVNDLSLHIGPCIQNMFTSDDMLLTANENITIDTYIATSFDKVIKKVEMV